MVLASRRAPGPRPSLGLRARGAFVAAVFGAALSKALGELLFVELARSPQLLLVGSTDGRLFFLNYCRPMRYGWPTCLLAKVDPVGLLVSLR